MKRNIVIIGAGTMGNGIAHTFAQNNFKVTLVDINQSSLDKAIKTISNNYFIATCFLCPPRSILN